MRVHIVDERDGLLYYRAVGGSAEIADWLRRLELSGRLIDATGTKTDTGVVVRVCIQDPRRREGANGHNGHRRSLPTGRVRYSLRPRAAFAGAGVLAILTVSGAAVWSIVTATRAAISWSTANYELIVGAVFCLVLAGIAIKATLR